MGIVESVVVVQIVLVHPVECQCTSELAAVGAVLVTQCRRTHICVPDISEVSIEVAGPLEVLSEIQVEILEDVEPVVLVEVGLEAGRKRADSPESTDERTVRIVERKRRLAGKYAVEISGLVYTVLQCIARIDVGADIEYPAGLVISV